MKADNLTRAGEQVKANVAEIAEKARDLTEKVKERWDDTYHDIERSVRRAKVAAEEGVDEVRHQIKARPLTSVASVAAGAFALGLLAGILVGRKSRD
jgi:ElaB/YqjD/DUF883 family membrane-anchored ribosome-binding protein